MHVILRIIGHIGNRVGYMKIMPNNNEFSRKIGQYSICVRRASSVILICWHHKDLLSTNYSSFLQLFLFIMGNK